MNAFFEKPNIYKHDPANSWINTFTGKKFFPLQPRLEDFDICDQAQALSQICRYTGHPDRFYSVAAHAIVVSEECARRATDSGLTKNQVRLAGIWGLFHDNAEAYIGDISYPLKQMQEFDFFKALEAKYDRLMCLWLGIDWDSTDFQTILPIVERFDKEVIAYEAPLIFATVNPDWHFVEKRSLYGALIEKRIRILTEVHTRQGLYYRYLDRMHELGVSL